MVEPIELSVRIDHRFSEDSEDASHAVLFGMDVHALNSYESLPRFFEDLIIGTPFFTVFATSEIRDVDTLFAIALFLKRDLAIHPRMPGLVYEVDLVHRLGLIALAHVDRDFARFVEFLRRYVHGAGSEAQLGERVRTAVDWIHTYVHTGSLPSLPSEPPPPRVLDVGTNGFVIGKSETGLLLADWIELFREGHLRGFLFYAKEDRLTVVAARKSELVGFDLWNAAAILNEMETAMGLRTSWKAEKNWLFGPSEGTLIEQKDLMEVFVRV